MLGVAELYLKAQPNEAAITAERESNSPALVNLSSVLEKLQDCV